jgi:Flp pilus assembly protein TadB
VTENEVALQKMQVISWIVLAVMTSASAVLVSLWFAWSVFAGGVLSIVSFWVSSKDVLGMIGSISSLTSLEDRKAQAQQGQKGYLLKFWIRIVLIGIVLLLLIKSKVVNIFGLILGLSTVVFTITFTAVNVARRYFFSGRR